MYVLNGEFFLYNIILPRGYSVGTGGLMITVTIPTIPQSKLIDRFVHIMYALLKVSFSKGNVFSKKLRS